MWGLIYKNKKKKQLVVRDPRVKNKQLYDIDVWIQQLIVEYSVGPSTF